MYLARMCTPDMLWSVNKVARAVTEWTKACDQRLARSISYSHRTFEYRQYCWVGDTAQQCRLGLFQDSDFAGNYEDSKPTSGGILCIFGSLTFVPISWTCKKQTSDSHSSTEAEVISLDAGLRNSRSRSLGFCDWRISFLTKKIQQHQRCKRATEKLVGKNTTKHAETDFNRAHQSRSDQYWLRSIKRDTFCIQCDVICLWGQWSRH